MAKNVILGSFLLVGEVDVAAHPAYLVEDMPEGEADPITKFQPCIVILGSFFACGRGLRPCPQATPAQPT